MRPGRDDGTLTLVQLLERVETLAARPGPGTEELCDALADLRADLARYEAEKYALRCDLEAQQIEVRRLAGALTRARRRGSEAAGLYVATHRLHATLDRAQVLRAVEEIVASLLGCEQMAVFEMMGTPPLLVPVSVTGLAPGTLDSVSPGQGMIGQVAVTGELWMAGEQGPFFEGEHPLTACIPLKVDGEVTGALALYALLEHRGPLGADERELLELLSTHAATALYASRLRLRGWNAPS